MNTFSVRDDCLISYLLMLSFLDNTSQNDTPENPFKKDGMNKGERVYI